MDMTREYAIEILEEINGKNNLSKDPAFVVNGHVAMDFAISELKRISELEEENKRQKEIIAELRTRLEIKTPSPWISNIN